MKLLCKMHVLIVEPPTDQLAQTPKYKDNYIF